MLNFLKKTFQKFFTKLQPKPLLTVKGYYLMKYCEKIFQDQWNSKDYVEEYEKCIRNKKIELMAKGYRLNKYQVAYLLWEELSQYEYNNELKEMKQIN